MTAPRFFARDRRNLSLSLALLLSVAAHLVLIFSLRGTLHSAAGGAQATTLKARLVTSRVLPSAGAEDNKIHLKTEVALLKPVAAAEQTIAAPALPPSFATAMNSPPAIALPLPFDPVFYTWREVDVTAKLQGDGSPPYPRPALQAGLSGRVTLEVWVDETGKVNDAKVIEADPPGYFEAATLAHYRALRFAPAMKDGKPRRFRARFLVEFGEPPNS